MERVLPFAEALDEVLRHASSLPAPTSFLSLPLLQAAGRVLAGGVKAERDQPPFPRSTRDGFAVRSADLASGEPLHVLGTVRAGEAWSGPGIVAFESIEIMTGAPVPAGADAVLMLEHASREGNILRPAGRSLQPGENIVPRGAEATALAEVIPPARRVGPAEIALAAACGYAGLQVYTRPSVAIIATGDELVEIGGQPLNATGQPGPEPWQIRNSNSYALAALVAEEGGEAVRLPIARDTEQDLEERLAGAREHPLILFSGGVSMGRYDLVEPVLAAAGAEFLFTGALIQPGKPVVFGRLPEKASQRGSGLASQSSSGSAGQWTYFFGLPGNPVSTEVCFRLFVAPLLRALSGRHEIAPRFTEAHLSEDVRGGARVTRFLPATVTSNWQGVQVRPIPWQGSGDLAANARANGFVVLPTGVNQFSAGDAVRVLLR